MSDWSHEWADRRATEHREDCPGKWGTAKCNCGRASAAYRPTIPLSPGDACSHGLYKSRCEKCGAEPLSAFTNKETVMGETEHPEHILQFFAFEHLPGHLQAISKPFHDLAMHVKVTVPQNPERTAAFRKLLEAKDAAVRAFIAKPL